MLQKLLSIFTGSPSKHSVKVVFSDDELHNRLIEYQVSLKAEEGHEIYKGSIREVLMWLQQYGYSYVAGTNGVWSRSLA